jgi:DNA-binding response OmpR family regulator
VSRQRSLATEITVTGNTVSRDDAPIDTLPSEEGTRQLRVLIAEDDAVSRRILQRAVERFGNECVATSDGAEAWQAYQDGPYDVVITDWVMPRLDGVELCALIRDNPGPCYTYVILLSVLSGRGHFLKGMQTGADDYLTKPLDAEELQARLAAAERVTSLHQRLARQNARQEALLREQAQLSVTLAETAEARGRLDGVTLATREVVHLLSNDLSLAVGAIELLRLQSDQMPNALVLLRQAETGLSAANHHLRLLQKVVRVRTKDTPVGPALDLARSTAKCG